MLRQLCWREQRDDKRKLDPVLLTQYEDTFGKNIDSPVFQKTFLAYAIHEQFDVVASVNVDRMDMDSVHCNGKL